MNLKHMSRYFLLVVFVVVIAFILDLYTARVAVTLETKILLDPSGNPISSLQVAYPLWHQVASLIVNFLYGLAAAIFITVFVANRLERSQQEESRKELEDLNEAINVNVFDSLFKTIIPKEIFKVIKQEIIENKVLRKEAKWIYDFSLNEDESIVGRMTTRYELHNISQDSVTDPIKLELNALGGSAYNVLAVECLDKDGNTLVRYDLEDEENNKNVNIEHNNNITTVEYSITIPCETHVEYKTVLERTYEGNIVDSQATKVPVIGADIIVNFPRNYKFDMSPTMSSKPRLITESPIQKIYRVDGGILPWQGFSFYLAKNAN